MKSANSAKEGMVRKVEVMASATFAARSLRYTKTPSETPITMSMASDMATTRACPSASTSAWSQLRDMYSRKLLILPTASQASRHDGTLHLFTGFRRSGDSLGAAQHIRALRRDRRDPRTSRARRRDHP